MPHLTCHAAGVHPTSPPPGASPHTPSDPASGARAPRTFTQRIKASPERVFPLLCPVREAEWLEGWTYELLRSESGYAEEGCVFRTAPPGEPETIWTVTRHEPGAGRVEFARVTAGLVATRLSIQVTAAGEGESSVRITYEFTPTSPAGERQVAERHSPKAFRESMEWWERSMNHFLTTGTILRRAASFSEGRFVEGDALGDPGGPPEDRQR